MYTHIVYCLKREANRLKGLNLLEKANNAFCKQRGGEVSMATIQHICEENGLRFDCAERLSVIRHPLVIYPLYTRTRITGSATIAV